MNEPKLHNPTFWVSFRSILQWIGGSLYFVAGVFVIALLTFFFEPLQLDPFLKIWNKGLIFITGVRLRVFGLEKLKKDEPYLFVMNHLNMFDHFFVYDALSRKIRGVEKEQHFHWPVYGFFARKIGLVPIAPKGDTHRAIQSLEKLKDLFRQGVSIGMFPEGTRSIDGQLQPFKKGAFFLAIQCKATVVPVTLVGQFAFNRKNDWRLYPRPVDIYIEDPISVAELLENQVGELRDQARKAIAHRLQLSEIK